MRRFILSALLLVAIMGIGQLLNHITATDGTDHDSASAIEPTIAPSDLHTGEYAFTVSDSTKITPPCAYND